MPFYVFCCEECQQEVEMMMSMKDLEGKEKKCPCCGSKKLERVFTAPTIKFKNPVGTDKWNSHDYRYKYYVDNYVRHERERAMRESHMGPNPYSSTDSVDEKLGEGIHDLD